MKWIGIFIFYLSGTASNELGVTRQAIYNRLQQPAFRQRLQNERQGKFQIANSKLTDKMSEAIETLSSIMLLNRKCSKITTHIL